MLDVAPADWPQPLAEVYGDVWSDPAEWARRVKELGADLVNLRLVGIHPDEESFRRTSCRTVKAVLTAVDLPLIIWGCDVPAKDQRSCPKWPKPPGARTVCWARYRNRISHPCRRGPGLRSQADCRWLPATSISRSR